MPRILGVVAEYNPFHRGHLNHLEAAKAGTNCNYTIVAQSGNFVQRGEPAIFDKWQRAKMALTAGADLVIEIPTYFVLQSAEGFARAGVALLANSGVTTLSFGSESGQKEKLSSLALWLDRAEAQKKIRAQLQLGTTYAAAVQKAVQSTPAVARLAPLLSGANDILAVEYLRAIQLLCPNMAVFPVARSDQDSRYKSASQLRAMLAKGRTAETKEHIPQLLWPIFDQVASQPVFSEDLTQALFYSLLNMENSQMRGLPACSEGLENRVRRALTNNRQIPDLIEEIMTKRYPRTRIQRLLMQALLQFHTIPYCESYAPYLRILACSANGKELLAILTKLNKAPLIFSARDAKKISGPARSLLGLDQRAADIYNLTQVSREIIPDILRNPVQLSKNLV